MSTSQAVVDYVIGLLEKAENLLPENMKEMNSERGRVYTILEQARHSLLRNSENRGAIMYDGSLDNAENSWRERVSRSRARLRKQ